MTHSLLSSSLRLLLCSFLVASAATLGPVYQVRAERIATDQALSGASVESERAELIAWLEREEMRTQLEALGVDYTEAQSRVRSLSDAEVHQVYDRLAQTPAGADFVGLVVGIIVVTVAVFLFTDLLGYTDVFPFINPLPRASASNAAAPADVDVSAYPESN